MKRPQTERLHVDGPAGALETLVESPVEPAGVAVICHPHPLYHGTMTNKVVHTLARAFNDTNFAAVRFNFRGVGDSEGKYDEATGETDDALAVVSWARRRWPGMPLWLAGFSFGAFVALRAATRELPAGLISIAVPVQRFDVGTLEQPACPWIVVQGDHDELVEADEIVAWIDSLEPGPELVIMDGVDHFFHGHLRELRQRLYDLLQPHITLKK
ncbi:MAG: alpha/beta hydrolase [Gammaproteobacteria bacterium]|nr:alpha/beta hydrolase [Gammaproteobacteria bacterium]